MGEASRRKWEARLQRATEEIQKIKRESLLQNFWEKNLFWGPLGLGASIILMLLAIMRDVRWLLFFSFPLLIGSLWVALKELLSGWYRIAVFVGASVVIAWGHFALYDFLAPQSITNEQLCTSAKSLAQRIRDFSHAREKQREDTDARLRQLLVAAKNKSEKNRIGREMSEALERWLQDYRSDFEDKFMTPAVTLRHQMLSRLPEQPKETLIEDEATFRNIGANAVLGTANRLEQLSSGLCPSVEHQ